MDEKKLSVVDYIIQKWFPIIGILFIVGGISYLFYDGVWNTLNETGRLFFGFILGVAFMAGGFSFEKKLKNFADAIIGGGILIFYVTLIYGSRFEGATEGAIIPEMWTLMIATLFSLAVVFYSYIRESKYILLLGMLGAYLTPFFIGQSGGYSRFINENVSIEHTLPLLAFLIYFAAINVSIFLVSRKMFLRGIGILNFGGLFVGTLSLIYLMGDQFVENTTELAVFSLAVVFFHIASMAANAKHFQKENDPFLVAGYLLPLLWFWVIVNSFIAPEVAPEIHTGLFAIVSAVYFGAWYYLRKVTDSTRHFSLYIGGILSIVLALLQLQDFLVEYSGPAISAIAMIFAVLFMIKPLAQRELSFLAFSISGLVFTLVSLPDVKYEGFLALEGTSIFAMFALLPFCLSFIMPSKSDGDTNGNLFSFRQILGYLAGVSILLIFTNDLFNLKEIPKNFLFFTLPGVVLTVLMYLKKDLYQKITCAQIGALFLFLGFFLPFFEILNRIMAMPGDIDLLGCEESLIGLVSLGALAVMKYHITQHEVFKEKESGFVFILTFFFHLVLWAFISHELLAAFNTFGVQYEDPSVRGIRAFSLTIWWAALGAFMTLQGTRKSKLIDEKNIGFGLLAVTILKLIFYDLAHVHTNLKVFLFIVVGVAILSVSYIANKKAADKE